MWNAYVWALLASYQLYDILLFLISGILCHGWMVDHTKFPCIHWNVHFHLPLFIWLVDNMTFCVLKDHMYWFSFALQMAIYALGFKLLYCWGRGRCLFAWEIGSWFGSACVSFASLFYQTNQLYGIGWKTFHLIVCGICVL